MPNGRMPKPRKSYGYVKKVPKPLYEENKTIYGLAKYLTICNPDKKIIVCFVGPDVIKGLDPRSIGALAAAYHNSKIENPTEHDKACYIIIYSKDAGPAKTKTVAELAIRSTPSQAELHYPRDDISCISLYINRFFSKRGRIKIKSISDLQTLHIERQGQHLFIEYEAVEDFLKIPKDRAKMQNPEYPGLPKFLRGVELYFCRRFNATDIKTLRMKDINTEAAKDEKEKDYPGQSTALYGSESAARVAQHPQRLLPAKKPDHKGNTQAAYSAHSAIFHPGIYYYYYYPPSTLCVDISLQQTVVPIPQRDR
ncbi:hypothetical protein RLOatenuis_5870 [Rickettsiales bacterium]|nr:hypothetical protein RLOatenuis_5870 [Rickettsiales bacterium]